MCTFDCGGPHIHVAIREMANVPIESMKTGGMLWFTDLTVPDPYYVLPVLSCASFMATIEVGGGGGEMGGGEMGGGGGEIGGVEMRVRWWRWGEMGGGGVRWVGGGGGEMGGWRWGEMSGWRWG